MSDGKKELLQNFLLILWYFNCNVFVESFEGRDEMYDCYKYFVCKNSKIDELWSVLNNNPDIRLEDLRNIVRASKLLVTLSSHPRAFGC